MPFVKKTYGVAILAILILVSACNGGRTEQAQASDSSRNEELKALGTSETLLATVDESTVYSHFWVVSPDGRRIAITYPVKDGNKYTYHIDVNGVTGKSYDQVTWPFFSPDSVKVAYTGFDGTKWHMVIDGAEGKGYDEICEGYGTPIKFTSWLGFYKSIPSFSPDSMHIAYAASDNGESFVVVDGIEGKHYDHIRYGPIFSPDSKEVAYEAIRDDECFPVVNGEELKHYKFIPPFLTETQPHPPQSLVFSPDSKRLAYSLIEGIRGVMVAVDGEDSPKYYSVGTPIFTADSKRVAHTVQDGYQGKMYVIIDGKKSKVYDGVNLESDFPSGNRLAFRARSGDKWFYVIDGEEGPVYDGLSSITFSPDGTKYYYPARKGDRKYLVTEEKAIEYQGEYPSYTFSPDWKHLAYATGDSRSARTVFLDGKKVSEPLNITGLIFSPDSKRLIYQVQSEDNKYSLYIDGKRYGTYDGFCYALWNYIFFDSPDAVHYIARCGGEFYLVEQWIGE